MGTEVILKCRFGDHLPDPRVAVELEDEQAEYLISQGLAELPKEDSVVQGAEVAALEDEIEDLEDEIENLKAEIENLKGEIETGKEAAQAVVARLEEELKGFKDADKKISGLPQAKAKIEVLEAEKVTLSSEIENLKAENAALHEANAAFSGGAA